MRWSLKKPKEHRNQIWFAWHPVRLRNSRDVVWLNFVYRTLVHPYGKEGRLGRLRRYWSYHQDHSYGA